jgi:hypothetical protein
MQKKRDESNPTRSDTVIASAIQGVAGGARNADGMPALVSSAASAMRSVPRVTSAHPAAVQINDLVGTVAGGSARPIVRPIQTGHSTNKRRACTALVAVPEGDLSPATKSRNTDAMIADFKTLQQEGLQNKAVKAQAALITAKGAAIQNYLQTLMFFERQPDSALKAQITSNAQQSIVELSKLDDSSGPRHAVVRQSPVPNDDESSSIGEEVGDVADDKECSICHDKIMENTPTMITPCLHTYHFRCLRTWLNSNDTCPYCRESLTN